MEFSLYRWDESAAVSLFTREWIEIIPSGHILHQFPVSLFTREWIEISPAQLV